MARYKVLVDSMKVVRDQRLRFINLEGSLELQGTFSCNGASVKFPANSIFGARDNVKADQGDTIPMNLLITEVDVAPGTSVAIRAELQELEFGAQGDDDTGILDDVIVLDGSSEIKKTLSVNISADNRKERGGLVDVTFIARLQ
jgi:hypothetical protein